MKPKLNAEAVAAPSGGRAGGRTGVTRLAGPAGICLGLAAALTAWGGNAPAAGSPGVVALQSSVYYSADTTYENPCEANFFLNGDRDMTIVTKLNNPDREKVSKVSWKIDLEGDRFHSYAQHPPNPFVRNIWRDVDHSKSDFSVNQLGYANDDSRKEWATSHRGLNSDFSDGEHLTTIGERLAVDLIPYPIYLDYLAEKPRVIQTVSQKNGVGFVRTIVGCDPYGRVGLFKAKDGVLKNNFQLNSDYWPMVGGNYKSDENIWWSDIDVTEPMQNRGFYIAHPVPDDYVYDPTKPPPDGG